MILKRIKNYFVWDNGSEGFGSMTLSFFFMPSCRIYAPAQFAKFLLRNVHMKRTISELFRLVILFVIFLLLDLFPCKTGDVPWVNADASWKVLKYSRYQTFLIQGTTILLLKVLRNSRLEKCLSFKLSCSSDIIYKILMVL